MATYQFDATYLAGTSAQVEFPEGKTWEDVHGWLIKWDTLHVQWAPNTEWEEFRLNSDALDCIDWKRPSGVSVFAVDESGAADYSEEIAVS